MEKLPSTTEKERTSSTKSISEQEHTCCSLDLEPSPASPIPLHVDQMAWRAASDSNRSVNADSSVNAVAATI